MALRAGGSILVGAWLAAAAASGVGLGLADDSLELFEKRVRPVLLERCHSCHSATADRVKGDLRLDSAEGLRQGGESGPVLVAGEPELSRLIEAIRYDNPDLQMPPRGKLPDGEIEAITAWVRAGAPWPTTEQAGSLVANRDGFDLKERQRAHWAWQPVTRPSVPAVRQEAWVRQAPDAFLLARLEREGLEPAPAADPVVLARRLHFDLIGLPPAPEVSQAFAANPDPAAYVTLVDELLSSPRFGERWARHWLDLVRYAETLGHEFDYPTPHAWRYRDYVVRALNADVPYDQFVREHVAGDLLASPRRDPSTGLNESVIGTAFYWLGQRTHSPVDVKQHEADVIDDQIDVLTKTFLGVTVACARCHDHKFDAISAKDYYALYGILSSSRYVQRALEPVPAPGPTMLAAGTELRAALGFDAKDAQPGGISSVPEAREQGESEVFVDFAREGYSGWHLEGEAFGTAPAPAGHLVVLATNQVAVLNRPCAHSASSGRRQQGVLASPTFTIAHRFIHILAAGRGSRVLVPVENLTMIRDPIYGVLKRPFDHDELRWLTLDVGLWPGRRACLEFCDTTAPDLADDGHRGGFPADGYVAVASVVFSDSDRPPGGSAQSEGLTLLTLEPESSAGRSAAVYLAAESSLRDPPRAPGSMDGSGLDEFLFIRGNPRNRGEVVRRRFLEALGSNEALYAGPGSGRLQLAREMTDPANPLLARVIVNRVWSHLFGRGLVPTPDDFGVLGQAPTHPELLDWLASWFREEGDWSIKALVRLLVTSRAYQMSSRPDDAVAEARDPANLWWHRMPIRRLEGEAIRDAMLAVSGRLDLAMYGPAVPVHLTEFMDGRGRPGVSGPLDGEGRRSIYVEVRRNFLSPMLRAFDTPVPFTTVGRRPTSNVPAQSLILLNDPFVHAEAARWAGRTQVATGGDRAERVRKLYWSAFGRAPTAAELEQSMTYLDSRGARGGRLSGASDPEEEGWTDLCHVLFNVKEFVFLP